MPTYENLTKSTKIRSLLVGVVLAVTAVALPANGEPQTVVAASASEPVTFHQRGPDALYSLPVAPVTTTTAPPPTTTTQPPTTTTHTHAPRPKPVAAPQPAGECGGWMGTIAAHFPAEQYGNACRIMLCESEGNPTAANKRSSARGLFQLMMSYHQQRFYNRGWAYEDWAEPDKNTAIAAEIWREQGWRPWACR